MRLVCLALCEHGSRPIDIRCSTVLRRRLQVGRAGYRRAITSEPVVRCPSPLPYEWGAGALAVAYDRRVGVGRSIRVARAATAIDGAVNQSIGH
jgi:hypothetical protein